MARTAKSAKIDSKTARLRLEPGIRVQEPVGDNNTPGHYLAYKRSTGQRGGTWLAYWVNKENKAQRKMKALGMADDYLPADNIKIFTYSQAKAMAATWFTHIEGLAMDGEPIKSGRPLTVGDALDAYFENGELRGMKGGKGARLSADAWIIPVLGDIEVSKLTRRKIESWQDSIAKSPRRMRGKTGHKQAYYPLPKTDDEKRARKSTANRILATLKAALNFVIDRHLAHSTDKPWRDVKPFRGASSARIRFLLPEEAARLVNASPSDFRDLVRGALLTGCRYGELVRLQCKDYSPSGKVPTVLVAESKSGKPRHIILNPEGVALFNELTSGGRGPDDLVFVRQSATIPGRDAKGMFNGTKQQYDYCPWGQGHQRRLMIAACKAAGLEYISFHELRHTYATMLVNSGCPLVYVASQLGHTDTRMVERHYGHIKDDAKAAAILAAMPTLGIV
ncbi:MAG: site-specific integrase [Holophagaceae bacterium]|nr:site-specific integrase [Holophagaceae bacterium]